LALPAIAQDSGKEAECRVIRALPVDAKNYGAAVPALVQWINSLPEDRLTPEDSNAVCQASLSQ